MPFMQNKPPRKRHGKFSSLLIFLLAAIFFFAAPAGIFAQNPPAPAKPAPATTVATDNKPAGQPPAATATVAATTNPAEKLFYSVIANESIFVRDKEMLANSRISTTVLQGNLEAVTLEVYGQGTIEQVTGDGVKDWSLRRSGARSFLEIRPSKKLQAGESFEATIVGKFPLDLPTTVLPPILVGTDATSFNGILRIVAPQELRLYAKQVRGLMTIGALGDNEMTFSIVSSPILRLDIARGSELLAPVSLENFSLSGVVGDGSAKFVMTAKASVRDVNAEIPVLSGEAALRDFPESSEFSVRAVVDEKTKKTTYLLKFPRSGDFSMRLEFDAKIKRVDGWKAMDFSVPAVQVAPFTLAGLRGNIDFAPSKVSVPQPRGSDFTGFLPASGEFDLRWREASGAPAEFSSSVFSADAVTTWELETGSIKQHAEISMQISQGALDALRFQLLGDGDVLNVVGQDILSWAIRETPEKERFLEVELSRKKSGAYAVAVETQTLFSAGPKVVAPLRVVASEKQPSGSVCVRFNELLRLDCDASMRAELLPQAGLAQINQKAFPQENAGRFSPGSPRPPSPDNAPATNPAGNSGDTGELDDDNNGESRPTQAFYRIANSREGLKLRVDAVRSEISVAQVVRCYFDAEKITNAFDVTARIRTAPLHELEIDIPESWELAGIDGEKISGSEIKAGKDGGKILKIVFTEAIIGETQVSITLTRDKSKVGESYKISGLTFPQARFVRGYIGLIGAPGVRMSMSAGDGIMEIPAEFFPEGEDSELRQVFRIRRDNWSAQMRIEKVAPKLHGNVSTGYKIERSRIVGNARAEWDSEDERVSKAVFALPKGAVVTGIDSDDFSEAVIGANGLITAHLRVPTQGKFSAKISFEIPLATEGEPGEHDFSGVRLVDAAGEQGKIFIKSDRPLALSDAATAADAGEVLCLPLFGDGEWRAESGEFAGGVLAAAYQYVGRPFDLTLSSAFLPEKALAGCVVKKAFGEIVVAGARLNLDCVFDYSCDGEREVHVGLPAGWNLATEGIVVESANGTRDNVKPRDNDAREYSVALRGNGKLRMSLATEASLRKGSLSVALPTIDVPVIVAEISGAGEFAATNSKSGLKLNETLGDFCKNLAWNFAEFWGELLVAVVILVASVVGKIKTRRAIFGLVATVAGAIVAGVAVQIVATAAVPVFGASVVAFSGGVPAVASFSPWSPLAARFLPASLCCEGVGVFVFAVGLLCVAAESLFRLRRHILTKVVGRILVYGVLILCAPAVKYCVPAFVVAAVVLETFWLVLSFLRELGDNNGNGGGNRGSNGGGNGGGNKPASSPATTVATIGIVVAATMLLAFGTLDLRADNDPDDEYFEELAVKSETRNGRESEFSRPQNIAERISQTVDILSDRVVATGEIRVKGKMGERFDLLSAPAVLTSFENKGDNPKLRLERRFGKLGIVYQIVLEQAGTFSATFSYEQALKADAREITLLTGNASADVVTARISRDDNRIAAEGAVMVSVLPASGDDNAAQIAQIVFKPLETRKIIWLPRERDRSGEQLVLFGETASLYVPSAGMVEGFHSVLLKPARGVFSIAEIEIPEPFTVSRVEGDAIYRWNFGQGRILTILFDSVRSAPTEISIYTQAANGESSQKFSAVGVRRCVETMKTLGIATGDDLQIGEISSAGGSPFPLKEFPKKLLERASQNGIPVALRRAFRGMGADVECTAEISTVKPNLRIRSVDTVFLDYDRVSLRMNVVAEASRADIFNLAFKIPEGMELENVAGDALAYWNETTDADGDRAAVLHLKEPLLGTEKFTIRAAGTFRDGAKTWEMPRIIFSEAQQQTGEMFVFAAGGMRLSLYSREGVIETDEVDVPADFMPTRAGERKADFAFRYFGKNWNAAFDVGTSDPQISTEWTQTAERVGRYIRVSADVVYSVENSSVREVKIRLPEGVLSPRFSGEDIVGISKSSGDNDNERTISFSKPERGKVEIVAEYFLPWKEGTEIAAISTPETMSERGVLVVAGDWARDSAGRQLPPRIDDFKGRKISLSVPRDSELSLPEISSGVRSFRASLVGDNEAFTEEFLLFPMPENGFLRIAPSEAEILKIWADGVPAKVYGEEGGAQYVDLRRGKYARKRAAGAEEPREFETPIVSVRMLYRNKFADGAPVVAPVLTNAHPEFAVWNFVPARAGLKIEAEEIFGLPASRVSAATTEFAGTEFVAKNAGGIGFETSRHPYVDAGAKLKISEIVAEKVSSRWKIFLLILCVGAVLRIVGFVVTNRHCCGNRTA